MKRKSLVAVFVFLLVVLGIGYLWYTASPKGNSITITVGESVDLQQIVIQKGYYSIHSASDEELLKKGLEQVVFDSSKKYSLETICGENDFLVFYNEQYYTMFRHFIPNDFYDGVAPPHHYNFSFEQIEGELFVSLEVEGQNALKVRKKLMPVFMSKNLLWGLPITVNAQ